MKKENERQSNKVDPIMIPDEIIEDIPVPKVSERERKKKIVDEAEAEADPEADAEADVEEEI